MTEYIFHFHLTIPGGFISFNGSWRVQGILAMSRSLGDYPLKNLNVVIPDPDIMTFDLDKLQPEFMILASDGLWDAFSNEEAVRFVRERLDEPHFGAKSIVLQSFYRGCPDNITVMVVKFKSGAGGSSKAGEEVKFRGHIVISFFCDFPRLLDEAASMISQEDWDKMKVGH